MTITVSRAAQAAGVLGIAETEARRRYEQLADALGLTLSWRRKPGQRSLKKR